jgi:shikimate kinase
MGAGKTSVGQALAARLEWLFVDLDRLIEARAGRRIAEIFRDSGEAEFRRMETAMLHELLNASQSQPTIVALGGGAFAQAENTRVIGETGAPVVFLDAPVEELMRRCATEAGQRPLFQNEDQFRQLYLARRQAYLRASIRIDTTGLNVEEVADELVQRLQLAAEGAS